MTPIMLTWLQAVIDDLERRQMALQSVRDEVARVLDNESPETAEDCEWHHVILCSVLSSCDVALLLKHNMWRKRLAHAFIFYNCLYLLISY